MLDSKEENKDELEEIALMLLAEDLETFKNGGKSLFADGWKAIDENNSSEKSLEELRDSIKDKLSKEPGLDLDKIRTQTMERLKKQFESEVSECH